MAHNTNRLRIIAGEYRGRKLAFPDLPGLRPTGDRQRETLFNWLSPVIEGARCADLFAGSGALGFEALSRGAGQVIFVDAANGAIQSIKQNLQTLNCTRATSLRGDTLKWLQDTDETLDIVFIDPPFDEPDLIEKTCLLLEQQHLLAEGARIYIEHSKQLELPVLPDNWLTLRSKQGGNVSCHLLQRQ